MGLVVLDQGLDYAEPRFVIEKRETGTDPPLLEILQGVGEQKIGDPDNRQDQQHLKDSRSKYRPTPECGLGRG